MEIVVDIRDMLAELVRKLWFIVILVIIGAVALGGFKFYKDSKSANAGNATKEIITNAGSATKDMIYSAGNAAKDKLTAGAAVR